MKKFHGSHIVREMNEFEIRCQIFVCVSTLTVSPNAADTQFSSTPKEEEEWQEREQKKIEVNKSS